jgi:phosphopantothenoylcysteine decarboxylase
MMWEHPITYRQIATLQAWGVRIVEPISKELACGDVGMGGMADVDAVTSAVRAALTPGR